MSLQSFFKNNAIQADTVAEVTVSDRFVDEEGKPIKWQLKALPPKRFMVLTSGMVSITKKGDVDLSAMDDATFQLVAETVVYPNLRDAELQNSYGVMGVIDLINEMLTTKEFQLLSKKVNELHQNDKDLDELVNEVKNS